jgi:hypothetical protein
MIMRPLVSAEPTLAPSGSEKPLPVGRGWLWSVLTAAGLAFCIKLTLALTTYGSTDSLIWDSHLAKIHSEGVVAWYRDGVNLLGSDGRVVGWIQANHPPSMAYLLAAWNFLSNATGLPLQFWLRLTSSLADFGTVLLLLGMWRRRTGLPPASTLLFVALSPVSMMVSGFHVNTDPLMVFFLTLSIFLIDADRPHWIAGIAFGLAMCVKVVPIVFVPVFFLFLPDMRRRSEFLLSAGAVFVLAGMPYLLDAPGLIVNRTFGYTPQGQYWGLSQMIYVFLPRGFYRLYTTVGKPLVSMIILLAAFHMNRRDRKTPLFLQCGCIASLFLFWAPGFGYQYLTWLVPWSADFRRKADVFYYAASAIFLFAVYTVWSRGLPWYFANTLDRHVPLWCVVMLFLLGATCWISIGGLALRLWRHSTAP